jgi:diguanylate cyclase
MAESTKKRRDLSAIDTSATAPMVGSGSFDDPASELEIYAKEVLMSLISDNLPPTPNNFSLYFDRILENKSESLRKQINAVLELEENNDDKNSIALEKNLKQGFASIKGVLQVSANLYKNIALMTKILDKRKADLQKNGDTQMAVSAIASLEHDVGQLSLILKKQIDQMKNYYDDTALIVKNVEHDTIFDNQFGVYNKRYLLSKIEQESSLIKEFKHKSSLIMIRLSKGLKSDISNEKALKLMTRTVARLLLKTSRRSDIVAHYGNGIFAMLLKHTDLASAKKASERLCELVSSSNFFLAEREIQLRISIGIKNINPTESVESIVVCALDAMEAADANPAKDFSVCEDTSGESHT